MRTNLLILIALIITFAGCKPETLPDIGDPLNKIQLTEGNWQLERVVQSDVNAVKYNFPYKELDVTSVAPFSEFKLSLKLNDGKPGTFTTNAGASPKIIKLTDGKWEVDDLNSPLSFNLIKNTDTVKMQFGSYNTLSQGKLQLSLIKSLGAKNLIRYDYYFKKI
ncbi:DUF5004 domain-containing protein [Pseudoflavitalea sp. G-6-1-2]|uniref:DUF5004 domain-containing protein n=1 Tax=Pseudoflavitalea sp. G-6-1-2 TaxID=2728841 RepID=UPI00146E497D|nr:DUF5004 domain-containing protein [Pseudoflavitalea sp. G-6-1-2]NML20208.1 DUF5004 domain-containing protein [Pseudoflavitalea sp. G-6-1-2]